jgi:hypothetical protein
VTLAVAVEGGAPPTEFRIFKAGENASTKGAFIFDEQAAAAVMAAYSAHGVEKPIDLEHLSLDPDGVNYDPDARGWCKLALRDGELWAVDVRWNTDGARRLGEKLQRYISPAFDVDADGRIVSVLNIAITALPATHQTPALVAASARIALAAGDAMDPEKQTADILKAMGLDPQIVKKVAKVMGLDEGADFATVEAALSKFKDKMAKVADLLADAADAPAEDAPAEEPAPAPEAMADKPAEEPKPMAASAVTLSAADAALLGREVAKLTASTTPSAALALVGEWRKLAAEHKQNSERLAQERAALEATERDGLAVKLAKRIGPGAAWADPLVATDPTKRRLAQPFAAMPLDDLRGFVAKLHGAPVSAAPRAPTQGAAVELSAAEMAKCAARGIDPVKYASTRAAIAARSTRSTTGV